MTLTEYKRQAQEIAEILMNFSGKEEEAEKFAKNLLGKYREFGEFNAKALECKNLAELKNLADANGMKFESEEEANELFLGLSKGKEEVEKAILSAEEMAAVFGGAGNTATKSEEFNSLGARQNTNMPVAQIQAGPNLAPPAGVRPVSTLGRIQGVAALGFSVVSVVVGMISGAFNDDAPFLDALPYRLLSVALGALSVGFLNLPGTVLPGR